MSYEELFPNIEPLLRKDRWLDQFSGPSLKYFVKAYWRFGTLSWVEDWRGRILGVCLVKLFDDIKLMDERRIHVPRGTYLMIEHFAAAGRNTMRKLFEQVYGMWGKREFILWDRQGITEFSGPRVYTWDQFLKLARRVAGVKLEEKG